MSMASQYMRLRTRREGALSASPSSGHQPSTPMLHGAVHVPIAARLRLGAAAGIAGVLHAAAHLANKLTARLFAACRIRHVQHDLEVILVKLIEHHLRVWHDFLVEGEFGIVGVPARGTE